MMPLGAPSISKYGSLVRPDAQIVALRLRRPQRSYKKLIERIRKDLGTPKGMNKRWDLDDIPSMSDDPMTPRRPRSITLRHAACDHRISMGYKCPLHTSVVCSKATGVKDPGASRMCNRSSRHRVPTANMRRV